MASQDDNVPTVAADQDASDRLLQQQPAKEAVNQSPVGPDSSGTLTADAASTDAATPASSQGGASSSTAAHAAGSPGLTGTTTPESNQQNEMSKASIAGASGPHSAGSTGTQVRPTQALDSKPSSQSFQEYQLLYHPGAVHGPCQAEGTIATQQQQQVQGQAAGNDQGTTPPPVAKGQVAPQPHHGQQVDEERSIAGALNSPSSGVPASEAGAPALQLLQLPSADQQQQHGAGQVANLSTQVPASPSRIAKRLREELADGAHSQAHSQAKRRLLQQELQVQELDAQQTELEWQLVQQGVANIADSQGPGAPQQQQQEHAGATAAQPQQQHAGAHSQVHIPAQQQQAAVAAPHGQRDMHVDVNMQEAGEVQQIGLQQQVTALLLQLAGVANQDQYEQGWDQQQVVQWLQVAQQMLLVFPQTPLLMALVQHLQEELMAWGDDVPWEVLGLGPMAAGPQPGQQQGAVGVPQWQLLYEQFWNQQQAVQLLQAAQQLLLVFPQQPLLLQLVQRLQEELMAWGDDVPMDLL